MKIVIYGLTITSSWGNGHATTYRSLCKGLAKRGHKIVFIEKDAEWYRNNRDQPSPPYCKVHLYEDWTLSKHFLLQSTRDADVVIIGSYFPDAIEASRDLINLCQCPVMFYDIDTPVTLAELRTKGGTSYLDTAIIPFFAAYLSFTGGPVLNELQRCFGAARALPFYCSVDPDLYQPAPVRDAFRCDMSYLGTYSPDRQPKLMHLLDDVAHTVPQMRFIVAGAQYPSAIKWQPNVQRLIHLSPPEHPAFYSSSRFTLNLTRDDMVVAGYSPSVRLFEASACGAPIISDAWPGIEDFFTPGEEILLPSDPIEVRDILENMPESEYRNIGLRAREHILSQHTAGHRAFQFEEIVSSCVAHTTSPA